MEMEHINENLIKVLIGSEDLEERGIDFLDLIGDQTRIEKFFYSILEEVDVEQHFHDSEAVTFQVIPNSEGLELYISRANVDDLDEVWEDELTRRLKERKEELKNQDQSKQSNKKSDKKAQTARSAADRSTSKTDTAVGLESALEALIELLKAPASAAEELDEETYTEEVVRFETLDDFLRLAREIPSDVFESDLYYMDEAYYLALFDLETAIPNEKLASKLVALFEYGEFTEISHLALNEHGQLLRSGDALAFFGKQF